MSKTKKKKPKIPPEIVHLGEAGVEHYKKCLANGCTEKFAIMLVLRKPPRANTDREYFAGRHNLRQQFAGDRRGFNTVLRQAKKNGFTPPADAVYEPGLARFQGDPEAFVPASEGRGYIRRLMEKRGWGCEGAVNVKPGGSQAKPAKPIDERLAEQFIAQIEKKDPKFKRASKKEKLAEVARKHGTRLDQ